MAEIFQFEEWPLSGRGLVARPILPLYNQGALAPDIQSIGYEASNLTVGGAPVTGVLNVAEVMFSTFQPWSKDKIGFSFDWPAPGTLWPNANQKYRIKVTFDIINPHPLYPSLSGKSFILMWQNNVPNPLG